MLTNKLMGGVGGPSNPNFANVSLLLHGDGTNGAQNNTFLDSSANSFTITRNGNTTQGTFSPFNTTTPYNPAVNGGSGYFAASSSIVTASSPSLALGAGAFTIEAFYFANNAQSSLGSIIGQGSDSGGLFGAIIGINSSNQLFFQIANNSGAVWAFTMTTGMPLGGWNHVCLVRSSNVLSGFLNGSRVTTTTNSTSLQQTRFSLAAYMLDNPTRAGYVFTTPCYIANARVVATNVYNPSSTSITVPTAPLTAITNTHLLLNFTNAGIFDNAMKNDLETVGNAQISTSVKKYGTGSMAFDGTGDYLRITDSDSLRFGTGDYTVEFFVYQTSVSGTQVFIEIGRPGLGDTPGFQIDTVSGVIKVYGGSTTATNIITASSSQTVNTWYHIALTRASGSTKLFVNGIQSGSTATDTTNYNQAYTWIGANTGGGSAFVNGYIDDLRITKGIAVYTANFTPPTQAFPNQ